MGEASNGPRLNASLIAACFLLAGFAMVAIDRRLGASRAAG